jgi:hypothetical protein
MTNTVPIPDAPVPDVSAPQYSPAGLVLAVTRILAQVGIDIDPAPNQMHVASLAAADLLRALGVRPVNAPMKAGQ